MKYFCVRFNETKSREFVVKAADNDAAEEAVQAFLASEKKVENVVPLRTDTSASLDTMETDLDGWKAATKKNKGDK